MARHPKKPVNKEDTPPKKKRVSMEREKFFVTQLFTRKFSIPDRTIILSGAIDHDGDLFTWFDACMTILEQKSRQTITIKIFSPGGDTSEACAIVGRIHASKCNIVTEGYGEVMSAATLILASGDKRKISKYAWVMWHESSDVIGGKISKITAELAQIKRDEDMWAHWMGELTKKDQRFWQEQGVTFDLYFSADEAIEIGIADEVI